MHRYLACVIKSAYFTTEQDGYFSLGNLLTKTGDYNTCQISRSVEIAIHNDEEDIPCGNNQKKTKHANSEGIKYSFRTLTKSLGG